MWGRNRRSRTTATKEGSLSPLYFRRGLDSGRSDLRSVRLLRSSRRRWFTTATDRRRDEVGSVSKPERPKRKGYHKLRRKQRKSWRGVSEPDPATLRHRAQATPSPSPTRRLAKLRAIHARRRCQPNDTPSRDPAIRLRSPVHPEARLIVVDLVYKIQEIRFRLRSLRWVLLRRRRSGPRCVPRRRVVRGFRQDKEIQGVAETTRGVWRHRLPCHTWIQAVKAVAEPGSVVCKGIAARWSLGQVLTMKGCSQQRAGQTTKVKVKVKVLFPGSRSRHTCKHKKEFSILLIA
ncbi:hypothetical protein B0H16DRAFT_1503123 [Mycena metata]|uniref:Uncharacterized protein n=1 Tax=Mycena metata TaxID=1033252 RepID=A0AAD7NWR4_9AGAR|nr:hypothetical protein B0H16DRAFT_1503123 [Mycena metata]